MCKGGCKGKCGCNLTSTTQGEKGDPSNSSGLGYKAYTALFNQVGTAIPVSTYLVNTTGLTLPAWTRTSAGLYKQTITGATPDNIITQFSNFKGDAGSYQVISDQATVLGYITYYVPVANQLWLEVYDSSFTQVDYSTLFGTTSFPIDIKLFF